jgi:hypothetical protein
MASYSPFNQDSKHQLLSRGEEFHECIVDFQYSIVILCLHIILQLNAASVKKKTINTE